MSRDSRPARAGRAMESADSGRTPKSKLLRLHTFGKPDRRTAAIHSSLQGLPVTPPSVSIVVTSYNYARYLPSCLESIANQSHGEFDCVIVDDASTDDSLETIQRFIETDLAGGRFRLVEHALNRGQMQGFLTGLEHTRGTFVVFVDADDILLPDFIATHLAAHLNGSNSVAFTCSNQLQIDAGGEIIGGNDPTIEIGRRGYGVQADPLSWTIKQNTPLTIEQAPQPCVYLPALSGTYPGWLWSTTSAMMYRRTTLDMILSPACAQFRICADYYLAKFCQAIGGSLIIPTIHGCHRRHGDNVFCRNPVLGGAQLPRNPDVHPPYEDFDVGFAEHVIGHFEQHVALLGKRHTLLLIARFAPRSMIERASLEIAELNPWLLLSYRALWKILVRCQRVAARLRFVVSQVTPRNHRRKFSP